MQAWSSLFPLVEGCQLMWQPQPVTGPFLGGSWGPVCGQGPRVRLCWPSPCPLPTPASQVGEQRLSGYPPPSSKKVTPAWPASGKETYVASSAPSKLG